MKETGRWLGRIVLASIVLNIVIEGIGRKSLWGLFDYMTERPLVFVLNTLLIAVPFLLLFLTKRKCFIMTVVSLLWLLVGIVNGVLLIFRTTPFTAADLKLVKYAFNMITVYMTWFQIILAAGVIVLAAVGCAWIWIKAPISENSGRWIYKVGIVAAGLAVVISCTTWGMNSGLVAVRFGNIGQAYLDYGIPYCFANSLLNTGVEKPSNYDREVVAAIEAEMVPENTYLLKDHETPNIIMIQLESFFDPKLHRNYSFDRDPVPFFNYLKMRFPSGYLEVPSIGAGTANTEFECITGMNLDFFGPGEYPYKTILQKTVCESMAFDMKSLGYTAHAIHNNEGTFYDRHKIFAQLGFDTFTPVEYMYDVKKNPTGWSTDEILIDEITKTLDSTVNQDFIYAISVQGHGAYPDFKYYVEQIGEMDDMLRSLIGTLNRREEPTVVVLYGDHLPGFAWEEADMKNYSLYQTEYVIWNNLNIHAPRKTLESYQLTSYVLDLLDIHEGTMIRFHQAHLAEEQPNKEQYLADMQVLEYDMLYGDQEIYDGKLPYEGTELQMGITPIAVDIVTYLKPNLLVFGDGFNEYSTVCMDDKPLDTMYAGPQLLIVKDMDEKKFNKQKDLVQVKQIGRDKVALGTGVDRTEAYLEWLKSRYMEE